MTCARLSLYDYIIHGTRGAVRNKLKMSSLGFTSFCRAFLFSEDRPRNFVRWYVVNENRCTRELVGRDMMLLLLMMMMMTRMTVFFGREGCASDSHNSP